MANRVMFYLHCCELYTQRRGFKGNLPVHTVKLVMIEFNLIGMEWVDGGVVGEFASIYCETCN
jgi:hypothetical protein